MRAISTKAAGKKYQSTFNGRLKHAVRQSRYRQKLLKKVTHQGSYIPANNVLLPQGPNTVAEGLELETKNKLRCYFCDRQCSTYLTFGFKRATKFTVLGNFLL